MNPLASPFWLFVPLAMAASGLVVLGTAGLLALARRRLFQVSGGAGSLALPGLFVLVVLGLLALGASGVSLTPEGPEADLSDPAAEPDLGSMPFPSRARPVHQTPFGSIADDIRLLPLEKSLSREITSSPAPTPPRS